MINFRKYSNVTEIIIPNTVTLSTTDFSNMFANMKQLKKSRIPNSITNMYYIYYNCYNLTSPPVCGDNVTDMRCAYYNCSNLTGFPVCGDNVVYMNSAYSLPFAWSYGCKLTGSPVCGNNVVYMYGAYRGCYNLTGSPVCGNNVIDMSYTYYGCTNLTGSPVCGEKVVNISEAYHGCTNLTGSPACGNNVINMQNTYCNCYNLTGAPVCGLNVTDMYSAYENCYNLIGSPVCGDKVTDMHYTYQNCTNLTGSPVCGPNVISLYSTYENCTNLTGSPVCGLNVTGMYSAYRNCYNLTGSPICGDKVTDMSYAYQNCTNLTGSAVCGENVIDMNWTYYNCSNLTNAVIGPNVISVYNTYSNCSSLSDLTILAPYVAYNNTLTNVSTDLQIYVPDENLNQYIESEWGSHGIFMSENKNIYLFSPSTKLLLFNDTQLYSLNFKKLNSNSSAISEVSVISEDETVITISNIAINEDFISFDMQSFEKEGVSTITITYSDGIQTYSSTFQAHVLEDIPVFTYSIEPIDGINYTFILDDNEEYYQNNTTTDIQDCAICKITLNANGRQKLYIDYHSDFYPNNYGYMSNLDKTLELSNTPDKVYLKRVGWNNESGSVDYGIIPFGQHEIYIKYYKSHWIEWGTGLFRFKIRIEDVNES